MANNPTIGVFIPGNYLNTVNVNNFFGAQDAYGNLFPTGLTLGKVIQIGDLTAQNLDNPASPNTLFGGSYQFIQVDSGATATNVQAGRIAFLKLDVGPAEGVQPEVGFVNMVVTSQDKAISNNLIAGVFINAITPGNFGFIFVGQGRVEANYASALTAGQAIGDPVGVKATSGGLWDDMGTTVSNALVLGYAVVAPTVNGTSAVWVPGSYARSPQI